MYERHITGAEGEDAVAKLLKKSGYHILVRNYTCSIGEIDIIATEGDEIVFIEVKTRLQDLFGSPAEAVNDKKKNHIYRVAQYYIMINGLEKNKIRFDVVEVQKRNGEEKIEVLKNAIQDKPRGCF